MKEWARIVSSIQLAILYSIAVIFYSSTSAAFATSHTADLPADGGRCLLLATPELFATEAQVASFIKNLEKLPFSTQKNYTDRFAVCNRTVESYLVNTFARYIYYSHYEVERFEEPDIIFPFQYFW